MPRKAPKTWRWFRWLLLGGAVGIAIFATMAANWSSSEPANASQAAAQFAAQMELLGSQPPYIDQDEGGKTYLRTELEPPKAPTAITTLHAMVWLSGSEKMLQTHIPMWFVRVKDIGGNGLTMLLSAAEWDMQNLQLDLDVKALERRGAGLLMDRQQADGSRLLVWSSSGTASAEER
jgi:hypothetical protein